MESIGHRMGSLYKWPTMWRCGVFNVNSLKDIEEKNDQTKLKTQKKLKQKHSNCRWFESPRRLYDVTAMMYVIELEPIYLLINFLYTSPYRVSRNQNVTYGPIHGGFQ